ncbi:MAG TPA: hypothetical protein VGF86_10160 [Candidatus Tumulicola sp.]
MRPTFGFSSGPGSTPERGVSSLPQNPSFLALAGLAFRLVWRRWPIFAPAVAIAIAVQTLVALVGRVPHGIDLDTFVVPPILTTLVYAFVAADARAQPVETRAIWERFLERSWAVIAIDFVLSIVSAIGLGSGASGNFIDVLGGVAIVGLSAMLVFADASATVDDDLTVWSVVPRAFARSLTAAWQRSVFPRAFAIFGLQLLVFALQSALYALLQHGHLPNALFWSQIPLLTVAVPPLSALTVLVYLAADSAHARAPE